MSLLELVSGYANAHADRFGVAHTPLAGVSTIRALQPSGLQFAINRPLMAIILQGHKTVAIGPKTFDLDAGDSLLITADVPTISQITSASRLVPYYSLVIELDLALIRELATEIGASTSSFATPARITATDTDLTESASRLMMLLDRSDAMPILAKQYVRELHVRLMTGKHGNAVRSLGLMDGHAGRIALAVAQIREGFSHPLRVRDLATSVNMSVSSFHHHFRSVTTLSPLQFQKQLRLIEARRLMLSEGVSLNSAAYAVGYQSVTQFSREYSRHFGAPPARDLRALHREQLSAA